MATEITMPKLSDTMTEGRLISWKKSVGEKVERGEIIAEVETDKATMELEAFASGVLLEVRIKPGETAPVGTVIGIVGGEGEKVESKAAPPTEPVAPTEDKTAKGEKPVEEKPEAATEEAPKPLAAPETEKLRPAEPAGNPPEEREVTERGTEGGPMPTPGTGEEKASPLVRRLAREKGIDLGQVKGSGPEGRVLQEDLEKHHQVRDARRETRGETHPAEALPGREEAQPLSRMRAAIARTVSEAWRTIPHFAVTVEVEMGEAERVRQELKGSGAPVSLNDLIVKAVAFAIGKFPRVNASFGTDGIVPHRDINIGIAVALDDGLEGDPAARPDGIGGHIVLDPSGASGPGGKEREAVVVAGEEAGEASLDDGPFDHRCAGKWRNRSNNRGRSGIQEGADDVDPAVRAPDLVDDAGDRGAVQQVDRSPQRPAARGLDGLDRAERGAAALRGHDLAVDRHRRGLLALRLRLLDQRALQLLAVLAQQRDVGVRARRLLHQVEEVERPAAGAGQRRHRPGLAVVPSLPCAGGPIRRPATGPTPCPAVRHPLLLQPREPHVLETAPGTRDPPSQAQAPRGDLVV